MGIELLKEVPLQPHLQDELQWQEQVQMREREGLGWQGHWQGSGLGGRTRELPLVVKVNGEQVDREEVVKVCQEGIIGGVGEEEDVVEEQVAIELGVGEVMSRWLRKGEGIGTVVLPLRFPVTTAR